MTGAPSVPLPEGVRICVVLLTGLGDVVHGLPVVNAVKRQQPWSRITWIVEPMPAPVLHGHPSVDEVVVFRKRDGISGVFALARELSGRSFDVTLNFNIYFKSVFPTVLSRAPVRVGFDRARSSDGVWLFTNHRIGPRPRAHTQDMFLEFLEPLGVPAEPLDWRLAPTAEERREAAGILDRLDRPVAAVVPVSANPKKDWVADRWARVIDALDADFGMDALILGGPSGRERRTADEILAAADSRPTVAVGDGVRRLLALIRGSRLLIAPDTGPVHMARASNIPVVGLYGHTNPWRVGPYRKYQDLWVDAYTDPGEEPDPSNTDPKLGRMDRITVDQVLSRVRRALDRYPRGPR